MPGTKLLDEKQVALVKVFPSVVVLFLDAVTVIVVVVCVRTVCTGYDRISDSSDSSGESETKKGKKKNGGKK